MILAAALGAWAAPVVPEEVGPRLGVGISALLVDRQGVPDAVRFGVMTGLPVVRTAKLRLELEPALAVGYSEQNSWSFRAGANAVLGAWLPRASSAVYVSTGLHLFRSFTDDETRLGLLWRGALGVRFVAGARGYVGFEPIAIERLPNGKGAMTPLRSRWGVEITFLSAGVWW